MAMTPVENWPGPGNWFRLETQVPNLSRLLKEPVTRRRHHSERSCSWDRPNQDAPRTHVCQERGIANERKERTTRTIWSIRATPGLCEHNGRHGSRLCIARLLKTECFHEVCIANLRNRSGGGCR